MAAHSAGTRHNALVSAAPITSSDVLVRAERHVTAALGDGLAMMEIDTGTYYLLDEVAAAVWSRLAQPTRVSELMAELRRSYDVATERCEADVLPFLARLRDKGLVRVQE